MLLILPVNYRQMLQALGGSVEISISLRAARAIEMRNAFRVPSDDCRGRAARAESKTLLFVIVTLWCDACALALKVNYREEIPTVCSYV